MANISPLAELRWYDWIKLFVTLGGTQSQKNCLVDGLAQQTISALQCQVLKPKSDKVRQTDCRTEIWESVLNHICISLWHSERF